MTDWYLEEEVSPEAYYDEIHTPEGHRTWGVYRLREELRTSPDAVYIVASNKCNEDDRSSDKGPFTLDQAKAVCCMLNSTQIQHLGGYP